MSRQKLIRNTAKAYRTIVEDKDKDDTVMVPMDIYQGADVTYIFEEFLRNGTLLQKSYEGLHFMFLRKSKADPKRVEEYFREKGKPDPNAELAAFCRNRANHYRQYA